MNDTPRTDLALYRTPADDWALSRVAVVSRDLERELNAAERMELHYAKQNEELRAERDRLRMELDGMCNAEELRQVRAERDRLTNQVENLLKPMRDKLAEDNAALRARVAELEQSAEVANRDAGLYCATLALSATQLGCEPQMVDHEVKRVLARVAELEQDKARLDWLEQLRDRHEMVACHKGKANPTGFRRYDCDSNIHLRGCTAAIYLRNELGQVVRSGHEQTLRAAIDAAKEAKP